MMIATICLDGLVLVSELVLVKFSALHVLGIKVHSAIYALQLNIHN